MSVDWGWESVTRQVGPLTPGRVYVIGARPSNGKTGLLMNVVLRWIGGLVDRRWYTENAPGRVLCAWTERSRPAALRSLAALYGGYDEDLVLREAWDELPADAEQQVRWAERSWLEADEVFRCTDASILSLAGLRAELAAAQANWGSLPDVLVVDYLQRIGKDREHRSQFDAWLDAMQWFRSLAAEGVTVLVGSQLKRRGDGVFDKYRPPHLEDFYGGGMIEAAAEVALGLFRPLKPMTAKEVREVKEGRADLDAWKEPGVMAVKCLKHTYRGPSADRMTRLRIDAARRITDYSPVPVNAGDALEDDDAQLPF